MFHIFEFLFVFSDETVIAAETESGSIQRVLYQ